jgi:hypothetical protein
MASVNETMQELGTDSSIGEQKGKIKPRS